MIIGWPRTHSSMALSKHRLPVPQEIQFSMPALHFYALLMPALHFMCHDRYVTFRLLSLRRREFYTREIANTIQSK